LEVCLEELKQLKLENNRLANKLEECEEEVHEGVHQGGGRGKRVRVGGSITDRTMRSDFLERAETKLKALIAEEEGGLNSLINGLTATGRQRELFRKLKTQMGRDDGPSLSEEWMMQQIDLMAESRPGTRYDANHVRMTRLLKWKVNVPHEELVPQTADILVAHGITDWKSLYTTALSGRAPTPKERRNRFEQVLLEWGIHKAHADRIVSYAEMIAGHL
jgi:hypothetical protein